MLSQKGNAPHNLPAFARSNNIPSYFFYRQIPDLKKSLGLNAMQMCIVRLKFGKEQQSQVEFRKHRMIKNTEYL